MVATFLPPMPLPADPLGQQLHYIFGHHPQDFLEAPMPEPGAKPQWQTIKKHPLRPRVLWQQWQNPDQLIGVRFTSDTLYALLDIDAGSPYGNAEVIFLRKHFVNAHIQAALEIIGITRTLLLRSSHSNGLHLYMPFVEPVKTFDLAVALTECLTAQGFAIASGQLEVFPNVKTYGVERIILYNGHRLTLQPGTGSCLLDNNLNPVSDRLEHFLASWASAAAQQDLDTLRHALKIGRDNRRQRPRRKSKSVSKIESWRQDLANDMAEGWTAHGQTNHLLKVIACHGHVFLELTGDDLITHTLHTAIHLPGYRKYCRHQHEIRLRVCAWCKAVENYYWPLSSDPKRERAIEPLPVNLNEQRSQDARQRIQAAMQGLRDRDALPMAIKRRAEAIACEAHISSKTLYRPENLELWHPEHCLANSELTTERKSVEPITDSASQPLTELKVVRFPSGNASRSLKPPNSAEVYTSKQSMKCENRDEPLPQRKNPQRGVRGDAFCLPQAAGSLMPSPVPIYEIQAAIQAKVQALNWTLEEVRLFLRELFEGRVHEVGVA